MKLVCLGKNQFWQTLENIVIWNAVRNKVDVSGVEEKECAALKILKVVLVVRLDSKTDAMVRYGKMGNTLSIIALEKMLLESTNQRILGMLIVVSARKSPLH